MNEKNLDINSIIMQLKLCQKYLHSRAYLSADRELKSVLFQLQKTMISTPGNNRPFLK